MLSSFELHTIFSVQLICLTAIYFAVQLPQSIALLKNKRHFLVSVVGILALQLGFAALQTTEIGDVKLFAGAGWYFRHATDFYFIDAEHTQYPFFPFLIFLYAVLNPIQELFPFLTFSFFLKGVLSIILLVISWFILKKPTHSSQQRRSIVLQLLAHPVTTAVIFLHGQVDAFLVMFVVAAAYTTTVTQQKTSLLIRIALFTASIASKTWSVLLLPFFVLNEKLWWQRVSFVALVAFGLLANVFAYTRLVDGSSVRTVLPAVTQAGGPIGEWGITLVLNAPEFWQKNGTIILIIGAVIFTILVRRIKRPIWESLLLLVLLIQSILPRWGIQYLFWSIPFWYLSEQKNHKPRQLFFLAASLYAAANYYNIANQMGNLSAPIPEFHIKTLSFITWCTVIFAVWEMCQSKSRKNDGGR
ncbi:hypothetical protein KBC79_04290 [Candidatus Woesebacteria bacterium]|nr:hypothetical protein [Candidatus Woesebacteria bacterium]